MTYVYILRCSDRSLYTGYTKDFNKRFLMHSAGKGAKYTRSHPPLSLEAVWETDNIGDALRLERRIKRLNKTQKEHLIDSISDEGSLLGIPARKVR